MLRNVFLKSLRDQARPLLWWALGMAAFALYVAALWPTVEENAEDFSRLLSGLPKGFQAFLGRSAGGFVTPVGYLTQQYFQLTGPILFLIFATRLGARGIAGEERAGTLDLLLSHPLPRWRVVTDTFLSMTVATTGLGVAFWAAASLASSIFGLDVSPVRMGEAVASAVLLGLTFGTLALAVGSATGSRGVAIGVTGAVALAGYLVNSLSALVPSLETARLLSPFHYYMAAQPLANGLDPLHVAVLGGAIAALALASLVTFQRRDLAV